ncbi:MAG: GNAT family N-acetyltransferase [Gammaproteobacteria bacterium]
MTTADTAPATLCFRPLEARDLDAVPLRCQGTREEVQATIADLGASAILAFEGDRHVAQLQFRRYDPRLRSPDGLWDPRYWGDFGVHAPALPRDTLAVFCYHVGQLDDSDARDVSYQGRGIGLALLDALIAWARERRYAALVAKCVPPYPAVMAFMGGQPARVYEPRGFSCLASWLDPQLREVVRQRGLLGPDDDAERAATVGCCVLRLA